VELTTSPTSNYQYTVTYSLFLDGTAIATVVAEKQYDSQAAVTHLLSEIPNLTWVIAPAAGVHIYEIRITVTATNIATASAQTRSLNVISFG